MPDPQCPDSTTASPGAEDDAGEFAVAPLPPGPESLGLARRAVRRRVQELGGDDALSYAAQLAVSEVVSALFERDESALGLRSCTSDDHLDLVIEARDTAAVNSAELRRRVIEAAADDVSISTDGPSRAVSVRLRFSLAPQTG